MYKLAPIFLFVFGFAKTVEVYYQTDTPIAGFQFHVLGIDVTDAGGGAAADAGFMISSNSTTVIGFSMSGDYVPKGRYSIMEVQFDLQSSIICLEGLVVAGEMGNALEYKIGECWVP